MYLFESAPRSLDVALSRKKDYSKNYSIINCFKQINLSAEYFGMHLISSLTTIKSSDIPVENQSSTLINQYTPPRSDRQGLCTAVTILTLFVFVWYHALFQINLIDKKQRSPWWDILGTFFILEFLYTGLFITCHDAMHGTVSYRVSRNLKGS